MYFVQCIVNYLSLPVPVSKLSAYPDLVDHLVKSVVLAVTNLLQSLLLQQVRFEDPHVDD